MRPFLNLPLVWKLAIPALLLAAIMTLVAWQAVAALSGANAIVGRVLDQGARQVFLANEAAFNINSTTTDDRDLVLNASAAGMDAAEKQFGDDLAAGRKPLAALAAIDTSAEGRALIDAASRQIDRFESLDRQAFAAARAGQRGAAYALMSGEAYTVYNSAMDTLGKLVTLKQGDITRARGELAAGNAAAVRSVIMLSTAGFVFGFGTLGLIAALLVVRPIARVTAALQALAGGDDTIAVPGTARTDEVGALTRALAIFRDQSRQNRMLSEERETAAARAEAEKQAAMRRMADQIEGETASSVFTAVRLTTALSDTAAAMTLSAQRTRDAARGATAAAGQTTANAQAVTASARQLSTAIQDISSQLARSGAIVSQAEAAASQTRQAFDLLTARVTEISHVARLITDIAARTNLLALNATIEATRAGDAGRGFAVVAGEVKQLANQTAQSTGRISHTISEVRAAASTSLTAVHAIEHAIAEVSLLAAAIASAVAEQGAATAEIAGRLTETAGATGVMSASIAEISSEADVTHNHAAGVQNAAGELGNSMAALRRAVAQVVRTSATEVDRRAHPRVALALPCRVSFAERTETGRLADLSLGGAAITGVADPPASGSGALLINGLAQPLAFRITGSDDAGLHIAFIGDVAATVAPLLQFYDGTQADRHAAAQGAGRPGGASRAV